MKRLEDLVLLVEVVEQSGFSAAARSLGLQRSKLSRRISELERRMGVRLLQRNTRRISLTHAGEQVYAHARVLAHAAQEAFSAAANINDEPQGLLRIACSATFAANALIPVVSAFHRAYPHVRIAINAADQYTDLISDRIDLAFRVSSSPLGDSSLVMRPIGAMPMILAASPRLVKRVSGLKHPLDASRFGLMALTLQDGDHALAFSRPGGDTVSLNQLPSLICNNMSVLQAAVAASFGIAILPRYLCRDMLDSGKIINALDPASGWEPADSFAYTLMPARHGMPATTRLFLEFAVPRLRAILAAP